MPDIIDHDSREQWGWLADLLSTHAPVLILALGCLMLGAWLNRRLTLWSWRRRDLRDRITVSITLIENQRLHNHTVVELPLERLFPDSSLCQLLRRATIRAGRRWRSNPLLRLPDNAQRGGLRLLQTSLAEYLSGAVVTTDTTVPEISFVIGLSAEACEGATVRTLHAVMVRADQLEALPETLSALDAADHADRLRSVRRMASTWRREPESLLVMAVQADPLPSPPELVPSQLDDDAAGVDQPRRAGGAGESHPASIDRNALLRDIDARLNDPSMHTPLIVTEHHNPDQSIADQPAAIDALLDKLLGHAGSPGRHPPRLASRALAYLTAAREGLGENELLAALALDDAVLDALAAKRHVEAVTADPVQWLVTHWSRLAVELAPWLRAQMIDGCRLLTWRDHAVRVACHSRLLADAAERQIIHGGLADMFERREVAERRDQLTDDALCQHTDVRSAPRPAALRRIMEQPWQLGQAGLQSERAALLGDFGFLMGKCAANRSNDLRDDLLATPVEASVDPQRFGEIVEFFRRNEAELAEGDHDRPAHRILLDLALERPIDSPLRAMADAWLASGINEQSVGGD